MEKTEEKKEIRRDIISKFGIDQDILKDIISFFGDISGEIPTTFKKDGISINVLSKDGKQYAEANIKFSDLIYYDLIGMHDLEKIEKKILIDIGYSSIENIDRISNIGREKNSNYDFYTIGFEDEESSIKVKEGIVNTTVYIDGVEFDCPGNIILWADVIHNQEYVDLVFKKVERLSEKIKKVRNDTNVKRARATIKPKEFERICNMGIWADNTGYSINTNILEMRIDNESGLSLVSRSKDEFYELRFKPEYSFIECNGGTSIFMDKRYIEPFRKLKGHKYDYSDIDCTNSILIEIRKDMPLILEFASVGINVLLTIPPVQYKMIMKGIHLGDEKMTENMEEKHIENENIIDSIKQDMIYIRKGLIDFANHIPDARSRDNRWNKMGSENADKLEDLLNKSARKLAAGCEGIFEITKPPRNVVRRYIQNFKIDSFDYFENIAKIKRKIMDEHNQFNISEINYIHEYQDILFRFYSINTTAEEAYILDLFDSALMSLRYALSYIDGIISGKTMESPKEIYG